jgi:hypothetical protein
VKAIEAAAGAVGPALFEGESPRVSLDEDGGEAAGEGADAVEVLTSRERHDDVDAAGSGGSGVGGHVQLVEQVLEGERAGHDAGKIVVAGRVEVPYDLVGVIDVSGAA